MNQEHVVQEQTETEDTDLDIELVGAIEEVTHGWVGYTYDVSWGDRHP